MPQIESLYIIHPIDDKIAVEIDLDRCYRGKVLHFDASALEDKIAETDNGNWEQDRMESAADAAYDSYRDSLMEG